MVGVVSSVSGTGQAVTAEAGASQTALSNNYELFLRILTTQIKEQDPLDPVDASEYTSQLVQYSSVEQQIKTNDQLGSLLSAIESSASLNFVNYIGTEIVASGNTAQLAGESASWSYNAPEDGEALIQIVNSLGSVVYEGKHDLQRGKHEFVWDGKGKNGISNPDGNYGIAIYQLDDNGDPAVQVPTEFKGIVDGVEFFGSSAVLTVGGTYVPVSEVYSVRRPAN